MNKLLLTLSLMITFSAHAYFHYPEERNYTSADRGYTQYGAPSLHHTGKYALTFDDGPHPVYTAKILDFLKARNLKATFFIITTNVNEKTFPLVKRMLDEGHILASHGLSHDNSNNITRSAWKARVKQSFIDLAALHKRAGHIQDKFYYRFPYAAYGERQDHHHMNTLKEISKELMGDNCIHFTFWDHDSSDWVPGMTAAEVAQNFKATNEGGKYTTYKTVRNSAGKLVQIKVRKDITNPLSGGVVLQHDIQLSSVEGTKQILDYVVNNNLEIVPLNDVEEFKITKNCRMK
ncbi:MAG: polysaccharide deacetylase family protein [Bdellovibrionales bacterium]|nr:polysaccharide deacetylase family protein [Bdellovibrionales bacterium]